MSKNWQWTLQYSGKTATQREERTESEEQDGDHSGYVSCTDKKENKIFLIYKEIQMGSGAKSYTYKEG